MPGTTNGLARRLCLGTMLVLLASVCLPAQDRPPSEAAVPSATPAIGSSTPAPASPNITGSPRPVAPSETTPPEPTPPVQVVPPCGECPQPLTSKQLESAVAEALKESRKDELWWSVGVNVFSERLDSWIFRNGTENPGMVALIAAWFTLVAALIKLALALNLPDGKSGSPSKPRRVIEIVLALVLCVSGALAVLAVHTAQTTAAVAAEASTELSTELSECQRDLRLATRTSKPAAGTLPPLFADTLKRTEAACTATATETRTQFGKLQTGLTEVRGLRVGYFLKTLIFLGFCGIVFLVWRALSQSDSTQGGWGGDSSR